MASASKGSIVLRAPEGEVGWTLIDLQGAMEPRSTGASLDGIEFGKLVREVKENLPPTHRLFASAELGACAAGE